MMVKELIDELKNYNPEAEITTPYSETIELSYISKDGGEGWMLRLFLLRAGILSKKIVDVILHLNGLMLDGMSIDEFCESIEERYQLPYNIICEVTYEETIDD